MTTTPSSQFHSQLLLLLPVILVVILAAAAEEQQQPMPRPGCRDKCGNISIPFPFGMGRPGCFREGFKVLCNHSFVPPRAFLADHRIFKGEGYYSNNFDFMSFSDYSLSPLELVSISVAKGEARVYAAVTYGCRTNNNESGFLQMHLSETLFAVSVTRNVLIVVGSDADAQLTWHLADSTWTSFTCRTASGDRFTPHARNGSCTGWGCCEHTLPADEGSGEYYSLWVNPVDDRLRRDEIKTCTYGMLVEKSWYNFSTPDMYGDKTLRKRFPRGVPVVLDFAAGNASCPAKGQPSPPGYACVSGNSSCANATRTPGYICKCWEGYDGNPYVTHGCQDIDECKHPEVYGCSSGICKNRLGGYDCPCKFGMKGDAKAGPCTDIFPLAAKVTLGVVGGISIIVVLVVFVFFLSEKKRMREFFIRNGGPMLEKTNNIKIFKEEELKRITKNYSHILGSGAFGVVYMGFLDDKQRIAVKKSKNTDKTQIGQFTNEVIIQSRVIHMNIVRLVGCCLEVDVPILVYEFVPNGSLEDLLHDKNRVPLTIDQRLTIAAESAEGLAYMHCKTSTNIQHGDVKPANILLDDDYIPKISDFGISRLIARGNDEHSEEVIGDNNYMDPVYRETGLLTNKSDVYSFGLVLYEIITGNKAIGGDNCGYTIYHLGTYTEENRANVTSGIQLGEDQNFELLQSQLREGKDFEVLQSLAEIARECLNRNVDQRPEMTDIAEHLQNIRKHYARKSTSL